jgi:bifunctional non-homologous end joining protein LigD
MLGRGPTGRPPRVRRRHILTANPRLDAYRAKRDPARTPEPFGGARPGPGRRFVVHKHSARRLHYDLRLEMAGVLASWAVPKGPSIRPGDKRLAVHVEDHPLEYGDFEGVIPEGSYGAGPSIVWDSGMYRLVDGADPVEAVRQGKLDLELTGYKLRGRWALVRTSRGERDWLLIKKADATGSGAAADESELLERYPESVVSGLTVEELRAGGSRRERIRARLGSLGAPRGRVAASASILMLAGSAHVPPEGPGWLFELKYDGVRVLAVRHGREVALVGRSGRNTTAQYPEIARAVGALPADDFVIDGEIVALDASGRPSFQRLQNRMVVTDPRDVERVMGEVPVSAVFFDCLALDDHDLRTLPLSARKACLQIFVPRRGVVAYGDHLEGDGAAIRDAACAQGLEGVVAKRAGSAYTGGRSSDWLKVKCQQRQEFVIGGYTRPKGGRPYFGALHLGVYDAGRLVYVGKVGTGFDARTLQAIHGALQPYRRATSPFDVGSPTGGGHVWVEPTLCAEVRFTEWTEDGAVRHPTFVGLRTDRPPGSVVRERSDWPPAGTAPAPASTGVPVESPGRGSRPARGRAPGARPAGAGALPAGARVRVTNADKVFWPDEGYTKGDLVAYYDAVAPLLLPYLRDRPLVLTRYPDGITGKSFYQKDAPPFAPDWIRTARIRAEDTGRDIAYLVVDDADALRYVVNTGTIPLHLWASRVGSLDRPDWLVLDLDPKGAPFSDVVRIARVVHRRLGELRLPSYVKTSGATGLHVLLPLGARYSYEDARRFAHLLATLAVQDVPEIATVTRAIRSREGKVYVDWGQNVRGQTIAAPFSARPRPGATVSCPLSWDEVTDRLDPADFTIVTVPRRFAAMPDPMAPVLTTAIDIGSALTALEQRLAGAPSRRAGGPASGTPTAGGNGATRREHPDPRRVRRPRRA